MFWHQVLVPNPRFYQLKIADFPRYNKAIKGNDWPIIPKTHGIKYEKKV